MELEHSKDITMINTEKLTNSLSELIKLDRIPYNNIDQSINIYEYYHSFDLLVNLYLEYDLDVNLTINNKNLLNCPSVLVNIELVKKLLDKNIEVNISNIICIVEKGISYETLKLLMTYIDWSQNYENLNMILLNHYFIQVYPDFYFKLIHLLIKYKYKLNFIIDGNKTILNNLGTTMYDRNNMYYDIAKLLFENYDFKNILSNNDFIEKRYTNANDEEIWDEDNGDDDNDLINNFENNDEENDNSNILVHQYHDGPLKYCNDLKIIKLFLKNGHNTKFINYEILSLIHLFQNRNLLKSEYETLNYYMYLYLEEKNKFKYLKKLNFSYRKLILKLKNE